LLRVSLILGLVVAALTALTTALPAEASEPLRAGIIGCDTSHVIQFTKIFNNPEAEGDLAKITVVAAFPGGSQDIPSSRDRVGKFTDQLREMGVERVDSIDALLRRVDVVLLESSDGRVRLDQIKPVLAAGKPVFMDKPVAASLADVVEIFQLAVQHNVPCFSSSAVRFGPALQSLRKSDEVGNVLGCSAFSPCLLEPHHPDLFWYGVHGVELLFTTMGTGCQTVANTRTDDTDLAAGAWQDGRVGTFRGLRTGKHDYGALVYGSNGNVYHHGFGGYKPLVEQIARFFLTGTPPVSAEVTIEIYAFMEAAHESRRRGGVPVTIDSVLTKARATVKDRH